MIIYKKKTLVKRKKNKIEFQNNPILNDEIEKIKMKKSKDNAS
jgi:hypothetical protein